MSEFVCRRQRERRSGLRKIISREVYENIEILQLARKKEAENCFVLPTFLGPNPYQLFAVNWPSSSIFNGGAHSSLCRSLHPPSPTMGLSSLLGSVRVARPASRGSTDASVRERAGPVLPMVDFESGASVDGSDDGTDFIKIDGRPLLHLRPGPAPEPQATASSTPHGSIDSATGGQGRPVGLGMATLQASISSISESSSDFPAHLQAFDDGAGQAQVQAGQRSASERGTMGGERPASPDAGPWMRSRSSPSPVMDGGAAVAVVADYRNNGTYGEGGASGYVLRPPTTTVIAANPDSYPLYDAMESRRALHHHRTRTRPRPAVSQEGSLKLSGAASAAASSVAAAVDDARPSHERFLMAQQMSGSRAPVHSGGEDDDRSGERKASSPSAPLGDDRFFGERRRSDDSKASPRGQRSLGEGEFWKRRETKETGVVHPFPPSTLAPCLVPAMDECLEAEMWEARDEGGFPSSVSHCEKPERPSCGDRGRGRQKRRPPPLKTPTGGTPGFSCGAPDQMEDAKRIATYCPTAIQPFPPRSPPIAIVSSIMPEGEVSQGDFHSRMPLRPSVSDQGGKSRRKPDLASDTGNSDGTSESNSAQSGGKLKRGLKLAPLSIKRSDDDLLSAASGISRIGGSSRTERPPSSRELKEYYLASNSSSPDGNSKRAGNTNNFTVGGASPGGNGSRFNLRNRMGSSEDVDPFGFEEASQTSFADDATKSAVVRARNGILPADPEDPQARGLAKLAREENDEDEQLVFGRDGRFTDAGFVITAGGVLKKPDSVGSAYSRNDGDAPLSSNMDIPVGSLDEFEKGPTLGSGAHGHVYLARHRATNQKMAVKVINVYDHSKRKQLVKELRTLLSHNNRYLVRSFGAYYQSGYVKVTLEYMDRGALSDVVEQHGEITEPVVRHIARDCLAGLLYLHKNRALHRDFKTANILLSRRAGSAKLSDFGLVRDLMPGASTVQTFVGTLAYMSPERLHGSGYTYASDVWGLGISLLECILGRYPFEKPASYFDYLDSTKMSVWELVGDRVSKEMLDFVSQCTVVEPTERATVVHLLNHPWLVGNFGRSSSQKTAEADRKQFVEWLDGMDVAETVMTANSASGGSRLSPRGQPSNDFFSKPTPTFRACSNL